MHQNRKKKFELFPILQFIQCSFIFSDGGPTWVNWVVTQGPKVKGGPKIQNRERKKHKYEGLTVIWIGWSIKPYKEKLKKNKKNVSGGPKLQLYPGPHLRLRRLC